MTGILLSVDELKGYIQDTAESTATLQQRIDDTEAELNRRFGPLALTADEPPAIAPVTERIWIRGRAALELAQEVASGLVVKADGSTIALAAAGYALNARTLQLTTGAVWPYTYVDVTYTPADTRAARRRALIKLIQLEMNYQPGMGGNSAGPWAESYPGTRYDEQREAIFASLDESDLFA